jgi:hypothetical protein
MNRPALDATINMVRTVLYYVLDQVEINCRAVRVLIQVLNFYPRVNTEFKPLLVTHSISLFSCNTRLFNGYRATRTRRRGARPTLSVSVPTDSPTEGVHTLPESFIASRAKLVSNRIWLRPIETQNTTSFAFDLGLAEYGQAS